MNYFYLAKSADGKTVESTAVAVDERALAQTLKAQGLVLIKALADGESKKSVWNMSFSLSVSSTEKIMFTRNLGVMFSTGLSLVKSMEILANQTRNKKLQAALLDVKEKVNKGENFSEALSKYPKIFSDLFVNMIKVGEESGTLDEIFQILALQLTREHELRSKIKNAMIYPSLILLVMLGVGAVIITFVLPSLNVFFTSMNVDIPIYTRIMLAAGNFLSVHWYLLFVVPVALVASFRLAIRTQPGKVALDTFLLRMPIISPIVKKNNSAFLIRSLSSLITAGVPLLRGLEITAKTAGNTYFKNALIEAEARVKKGERLSGALKVYQNLFPLGVVEMVEVGEETGKTSVILKKLADFYEQEAINAVEKVALLIEPLMIIVLGLGVGFFAFSIIQPMYSSLKLIS